MRTAIRSLLLLALLLIAPRASAQYPVEAGDADCSTPRRALLTWLANLQEGDDHPELAARCFDWSGARVGAPADQQDLARRLKRVLDHRGLWIDMETVVDEESPGDTVRVSPFPNRLPGFYLERREGWKISADSIRRIRGWYDETFPFDVERVVAELPEWMRARALGSAWWQWIGLVLLCLLALVARQIAAWAVQSQGSRLLRRFAPRLDATLLHRAGLPIGTLLGALLLTYTFPLLRFGVDFSRVLLFGLRIAAAVSSVLIVYRFVDVASDVMAKRAERTETKLDDQLVPLIRKSLKVVTVLLGFVFVLQNLEVDVASLIAGLSLGGLAFTLAARDTVANLFGSISVFADQPFQVGDWVSMQGVEGTIEEVGMRSTRVRTVNRSVVSIPNAKVADGIIDNYGARDARRTQVKLGVQYDTTPEQMEAFCEGLRAILAANPAVKKDNYLVFFSGFGDSFLEITFEFFLMVSTRPEDMRHRHNIFLDVLRLASTLGVQFAFPTRTLHVASQATPAEQPASPPLGLEALAQAILAFGPGGSRVHPEGAPITHGFLAGATPEPPRTDDARSA